MGRDTTASKRMSEKRSREKAAGLRRLNVAVTPEVFDRLAMLMNQLNCTSQARLIELLVMDCSKVSKSNKSKDDRNVVTAKVKKVLSAQKELSSKQMSLFD